MANKKGKRIMIICKDCESTDIEITVLNYIHNAKEMYLAGEIKCNCCNERQDIKIGMETSMFEEGLLSGNY